MGDSDDLPPPVNPDDLPPLPPESIRSRKSYPKPQPELVPEVLTMLGKYRRDLANGIQKSHAGEKYDRYATEAEAVEAAAEIRAAVYWLETWGLRVLGVQYKGVIGATVDVTKHNVHAERPPGAPGNWYYEVNSDSPPMPGDFWVLRTQIRDKWRKGLSEYPDRKAAEVRLKAMETKFRKGTVTRAALERNRKKFNDKYGPKGKKRTVQIRGDDPQYKTGTDG